MKRQRGEELLVASWDAPLAAAEAAELASCLEGDPDLAALAATWDAMGALESEVEEAPSERLRARFYAALAEAQAAERRGGARPAWWTRPQSLRLAAGLGWAALGLIAGLGAAGLFSARAEVRALREEVRLTHQTTLLALLEHQTASERLRAVSWSDQWGPDGRLVDALIEVVLRDPTVNVRLAAVEALGKGTTSPAQRRELAESLPSQPSPLLQVRLVELLYGDHDSRSRPDADALLEPGTLDEAARQRLLQLTGGEA